jgi:hypothetical protein
MSNPGTIHFRNEGLDIIQSQTKGHQEQYVEIWNQVRNELMGLVSRGEVDAQVGGVLQERDTAFRREAAGYDESVTSQNGAIRQVQDIGNEGGARMVRTAAGGA